MAGNYTDRNYDRYARSRDANSNKQGGLKGFWGSLIQSAAFSLRVFFRNKIGERSYSFGLILSSYLWVRLFPANWTFNKPEPGPDADFPLLYSLASYIEQFFTQLWDIVVEAFSFNLSQADTLIEFYSYLVLIFGFIHWLGSIKRNLLKIKWYSYSRGESVFLGWLEGKRLFNVRLSNNKERPIKISYTFIWMIIEPLFIIFLGFMLIAFEVDAVLGFCLGLSAIALIIEEYVFYRNFRSEQLDIIDAEYRGTRIKEAMARYDLDNDQEFNSVASEGVSLANESDQEKMKNFINSRKHTATNAVGGADVG